MHNDTPDDITALKAALRAGLEAALKIVPPADMARELGVSVQAVCNWQIRGFIPPKRVLDVQRVLKGRVSLHRLRPDYYPRATKVRSASHQDA